MAYLIQYFFEGLKKGEVTYDAIFDQTMPKDRSLKEAIRKARKGLAKQEADFVRIVDVDGSGAEVWSERKENLTSDF